VPFERLDGCNVLRSSDFDNGAESLQQFFSAALLGCPLMPHDSVMLGGEHDCTSYSFDGHVDRHWRFTSPFTVVAEGIVPFFIDWGQTPHPSSTAAPGLTLIDLRAEHPDPKPVQKMLSQLGLDLPLQAGSKPVLIATITGPRGVVELR
jgi:hypothetical protein